MCVHICRVVGWKPWWPTRPWPRASCRLRCTPASSPVTCRESQITTSLSKGPAKGSKETTSTPSCAVSLAHQVDGLRDCQVSCKLCSVFDWKGRKYVKKSSNLILSMNEFLIQLLMLNGSVWVQWVWCQELYHRMAITCRKEIKYWCKALWYFSIVDFNKSITSCVGTC